MVVVIVDVPWLPWAIAREDGEAEIVKLPVADSGKVNSRKLTRQIQRIGRRFENMMSMSFLIRNSHGIVFTACGRITRTFSIEQTINVHLILSADKDYAVRHRRSHKLHRCS